jgi:hypothetical protein
MRRALPDRTAAPVRIGAGQALEQWRLGVRRRLDARGLFGLGSLAARLLGVRIGPVAADRLRRAWCRRGVGPQCAADGDASGVAPSLRIR